MKGFGCSVPSSEDFGWSNKVASTDEHTAAVDDDDDDDDKPGDQRPGPGPGGVAGSPLHGWPDEDRRPTVPQQPPQTPPLKGGEVAVTATGTGTGHSPGRRGGVRPLPVQDHGRGGTHLDLHWRPVTVSESSRRISRTPARQQLSTADAGGPEPLEPDEWPRQQQRTPRYGSGDLGRGAQGNSLSPRTEASLLRHAKRLQPVTRGYNRGEHSDGTFSEFSSTSVHAQVRAQSVRPCRFGGSFPLLCVVGADIAYLLYVRHGAPSPAFKRDFAVRAVAGIAGFISLRYC